MAQVQMTINVDSQMQQQIDRYCTLSGLTRKAWAAIENQRAKAERGETPELTMEEIIAEIQQAHEERIHENR